MASSLTNLLYHIVYSTKHRELLIEPNWQDDLYAYIGGIIRDLGGTLIAAGGIADHIHLATRLPSRIALSEVIKTFKAKSSLWVNEQQSPVTKFHWQTGYGAFTVSPSQLPTLIDYIRNQVEHHRKVSFKDEFLALLRKHEIEFDERYLWD